MFLNIAEVCLYAIVSHVVISSLFILPAFSTTVFQTKEFFLLWLLIPLEIDRIKIDQSFNSKPC